MKRAERVTETAGVAELVCRPIGVVHSPFRERAEAPRQPAASEARGTIELYADSGFEHALSDLETWSHLWVIFWFHLNEGFRPKVLPPRSSRRRGVFATRSPHRPNPLGISAVRLERVNGLVLEVSGLDMLDGTPVLDLKPYVAYTDAVSDAGSGWLSGALDPVSAFSVEFSERARVEIAFLREAFGIELEAPVRSILALGPQAHPYRRIRRERTNGTDDAETFVLAVKEWRARFVVDGPRIVVTHVRSGYRPREIVENPAPDLDVHRAFVERFGT
ncbi:MAG TPA: tRNA (N6-threonylcarbamoyladenosine(37)-N6)-methyltransferase TrmO [Polyangiaceae bacterium]